MNRIKHESESMIEPKEQIGSPVNDEDSSGGSAGRGGGGILKKGPWTSAEDAILQDYVKKHGEGNWNAVQKHSGLSRCGKSCRLRWANHLRPNLKKGAITQEEEMKIVELHAKMGNKWARMASILKGRTDNEIKNYWNTRTKRLQRAGLPVYPPGITYDPSNDNPQSRGSDEFSDFDKHHNEVLQGNKYSIIPTGGIFGNYKPDLGDLSYPSLFSDYPTPGFGFVDHGGNCLKRFRDSDSFLPSGLPIFEQFGPAEKIQRSFGLGYPSHPDLIRKNMMPFGGPIPGSHALPNGNLSISRPLPGSVKLELPSLQFPDTTDLSTCLASSPPLEAVDAYIRLPPTPCVSPRNSGLLEDLLHESQALSSTTKNQASKSSSSALMVESPLLDIRDSDWGEYNDPNTPLGINATSVFSSSSVDDFLPSKATTSSSELDGPMHMDNLRPDALLASDWLDDTLRDVKDDLMLNDNIELFLDDELCSEYKQVPSGEMSPTIMGEEMGLESYPWNNMPSVYQMSEIP